MLPLADLARLQSGHSKGIYGQIVLLYAGAKNTQSPPHCDSVLSRFRYGGLWAGCFFAHAIMLCLGVPLVSTSYNILFPSNGNKSLLTTLVIE